MLRVLAPAKVNWYLEIPGRRPDGFHEIATVMQSIDLCDELTFADRADGEITLDCDTDLGSLEHNLVWRAARLMQQHAPGRGADITLRKRIPHGAGLGGGSSDAAATINALDRLWGVGLSEAARMALAAQLGSDCAFFVRGGTALCTGRGEVVTPLTDQPGLHLVILYPGAVSPTRDVYADLASRRDYAPVRTDLAACFSRSLSAGEIAPLIHNRLQQSALRSCPALAAAWQATADTPALARFVSGSGSSIAFLIGSNSSAQSLASALPGCAVTCRTL